jgi:predicted dienelactone hydrolase
MRQHFAARFLHYVILPLLLAAHVATAAPAQDQPIKLETATGAIEGSLRLPVTSGKVPVALIIAGSGPTDRDGNNPAFPGPNNSLRMLAETLAQAGFASVLALIPGMNHVLKQVPDDQQRQLASYGDPALPLDPELRRAVTDFLRSVR